MLTVGFCVVEWAFCRCFVLYNNTIIKTWISLLNGLINSPDWYHNSWLRGRNSSSLFIINYQGNPGNFLTAPVPWLESLKDHSEHQIKTAVYENREEIRPNQR